MTMNTTDQTHEIEATGWQRGVYDDIKRTFRTPFINWIFRTTMANYPEFLRYAWGQLKPIFDTRAFARFSVEYRNGILSTVEKSADLPVYRCEEIDIVPSEYRELHGQLATFDIVAPRLAVLFEVMDRTLHDNPAGENPNTNRETTAPFPNWLDGSRGVSPTMIGFDEIPDELDDTISSIQAFHGFDSGLPSIYRCLAQWPALLNPLWSNLEPILKSDTFDRVCAGANERVSEYVDSIPYRPRLTPDGLRHVGFDTTTIEDLKGLFHEFNQGAVATVVPALPLYATTVDATGTRRFP